MQDIVELYSLKKIPGFRTWTPLGENAFINVQQVISLLLPRMLGVSSLSMTTTKMNGIATLIGPPILCGGNAAEGPAHFIHQKMYSKCKMEQFGCVVFILMGFKEQK